MQTKMWIDEESSKVIERIVFQQLPRRECHITQTVMSLWAILSTEPIHLRIIRVLEAGFGPLCEVSLIQLQFAVCLVFCGEMPLCQHLMTWIEDKLHQLQTPLETGGYDDS